MAKPPADIRYTREHEWVRMDGDIATIGITDHAQEQLGDVVFVELPEIGRDVSADEACAVVESVKAASDVYAPLTGKVLESLRYDTVQDIFRRGLHAYLENILSKCRAIGADIARSYFYYGEAA